MPSRPLGNSTPYERVYGKKPETEHLRASGRLCFVSTPKQHRAKLDFRADGCVFIGYSPTQNGYKVLHLETRKVFGFCI